MNNEDRRQLSKAQNVIFAANNPAFNFHFVKDDKVAEEAILDCKEIMIPMDRYDWSIKKDEGDEYNLPKLVPLTMASCGDNLEDLEAWYAAKYPNFPSEYHGIMARYSSNKLLTKKETKNAVKKLNKKNTEVPVGLKVVKGDHKVYFD
jgi:hypothetical protein